MVIELSGGRSAIRSEIKSMILKSDERAARVRFEITRVSFQTKIARHEVQLPLYLQPFWNTA